MCFLLISLGGCIFIDTMIREAWDKATILGEADTSKLRPVTSNGEETKHFSEGWILGSMGPTWSLGPSRPIFLSEFPLNTPLAVGPILLEALVFGRIWF